MTLWGEPDQQLHAYDCYQNATQPRATEITQNTHACTQELCLAEIHKHAAHRLVQHRLKVVEMAWTDDSILTIFFYTE